MSEVRPFTATPEEGEAFPAPTNGKAHTASPTTKMSDHSSKPPHNPAPQAGALPDIAGALNSKKAKGAATTKSIKQQSEIPVRTPDKKWWFRASTDPTMTLHVEILDIEDGPNEGLYFLHPDVEFPDELQQYAVPALITLCITSDGTLFFYLAKQSAKSPKGSTRLIIHEAKSRWIKQQWNPAAKAYDYTYASQLRRAPVWPETPLNELLNKAFGDRFLTDVRHPAITMLINPNDDDQADFEAEQIKADGEQK
jgi:hypothetical protein